MLSILRNSANSFVIKVLMIMLLLTFVFWGLGDSFSNSKPYVLKVADKTYNESQFYNLYLQQASIVQQQTGYDLTKAQLNNPQVKQYLLTLLINRLITKNISTEIFDVSDDMVKFEIASIPVFSKDNRFDKDVFDEYLRQTKMTENALVDMVKDDLATRNIGIMTSVINYVPAQVAKAIYQAQQQTRTIKVATIDQSLVKSSYDHTDQQLEDIYHKNSDKFTLPESREVSYLTIDEAVVKDMAEVSESVLKEIYHSQPQAFTEQAKRGLRQIIFKNLDDAKSAHKLLVDGKQKFDDVATKFNTNPKVKNLGIISIDYFSPEISKPLFTLAENQISQPIKSPLGYHIFIVDKIYPAQLKSFDEVKSKIKASYLAEQRFQKLNELIQAIDKEITAGKSIEEIASQYQLKTHQQTLVKGGNGTKSPHLYDQAIFIDQVFSTEGNYTSPVIPLPQSENKYFVLKVNKIVPAKLLPFDQVKPQVIKMFNVEQTGAKLAEVSNDIYTKLLSGTPFDEVANGYHLKTVTYEGKTMAQIADLPGLRDAVKLIFSAKKQSYLKPFKANDGKYQIVYIGEINNPDLKNLDTHYKEINVMRNRLDVSRELVDQLVFKYRQKHKVVINDEQVSKMQF